MAIKYQNEVPQYICISVILIDSVFRIGENYCPQVFLEECKYVVKKKKKKKMPEYDSDKKIPIQEILMKKILMKKILMKKMLTLPFNRAV